MDYIFALLLLPRTRGRKQRKFLQKHLEYLGILIQIKRGKGSESGFVSTQFPPLFAYTTIQDQSAPHRARYSEQGGIERGGGGWLHHIFWFGLFFAGFSVLSPLVHVHKS